MNTSIETSMYIRSVLGRSSACKIRFDLDDISRGVFFLLLDGEWYKSSDIKMEFMLYKLDMDANLLNALNLEFRIFIGAHEIALKFNEENTPMQSVSRILMTSNLEPLIYDLAAAE